MPWSGIAPGIGPCVAPPYTGPLGPMHHGPGAWAWLGLGLGLELGLELGLGLGLGG